MNRSQVYKSIFTLVLMFVMLLLVACGRQEDVDTAPTVADLASQLQIVTVEAGGS